MGANKVNSEVKELTLYYDSPCKMLVDVRDKLESSRGKGTPCASFDYLLYHCRMQYDLNWIPLLSNITNCAQPRHSRGIGTELIKTVGIGATNFLLSKFISSEDSILDKDINENLLRDVRKESIDILTKTSKVQDEVIRKIQEVSQASENHLDEIREVSYFLPKVVMAALDVYSKMLAGIADYKAILRYCRIGQLAFRELSELLGYEELGTLNLKYTILKGLLVNTQKGSITFYYKVKIQDGSSKILWFEITIAFGAILSFLGIGCVVSWRFKLVVKKMVSNQRVDETRKFR